MLWLWVKLTKRNLFSKVPRYMGKFIERQMVEKERARKSILGRVRTWRGEELSVSVVGLVDKEKPICRHKSWTQPSTDAATLPNHRLPGPVLGALLRWNLSSRYPLPRYTIHVKVNSTFIFWHRFECKSPPACSVQMTAIPFIPRQW